MWTFIGARIARFWIARLGSVNLPVGTRGGHTMFGCKGSTFGRAKRAAGRARARRQARGVQASVRGAGERAGVHSWPAGTWAGVTIHQRAGCSPEMVKST
ncbi:hypothetical protein CRG98_018796 [Punica granatum]|uniref:Uncharacterized protein n=1 Tax=Punica granatum TaxID=22663 RepID=A0A2I0JWW5_PUNGR|nr:hypothetical protein CRG98_018796 [Punica granatum]